MRIYIAVLILSGSLTFYAWSDDPPVPPQNSTNPPTNPNNGAQNKNSHTPKPQEIIAGISVGPLDEKTILEVGPPYDIKIPFADVMRVEEAYITNEKRQQPRAVLAPQMQADLRKEWTFQFLVNAMVRKYAADNKLELSKEVFEEKYAKFKKSSTPPGLSYEQKLADDGLRDEDVRKYWNADWAISDKLSAELTDDEVLARYEQVKDTLPMRRASHILFMYVGAKAVERADKLVTRNKDAARKDAEDAAKKLKEGADFNAYAKQHSDCPSQTDLNYFALKGGMIEQIAQAAYKLEKVGDISDVIETPSGFDIIKLTALRNPKDYRNTLVQQQLYKLKMQLVLEAAAKAKFNEKMVTVKAPDQAK